MRYPYPPAALFTNDDKIRNIVNWMKGYSLEPDIQGSDEKGSNNTKKDINRIIYI